MNIGVYILYGFMTLFSMSGDMDNDNMCLNYFEYNRGMSSPVIADFRIRKEGWGDYTFNDVVLYDYSFFPDNSIFPNAFFKPLLELDIVNAVKASTEPYYGIRFYHFFEDSPQFGWGIEFIHFKVFLPDSSENQQTVHITGTDENDVSVDEWNEIHNYIQYMSISHGVNHLSYSMVYRMMLLPTEKIPQGRIQPYVSASLGICIPHPELKLTGETERDIYSYQIGFPNFGGGFNLGTRFQWSKHSGMYLEYKYTYTYLHGMRLDNAEGEFDASFAANHFVWGLFLNL